MHFEKIEQLTSGQLSDLHRMYQEEWWTKGRGLEDVRRMLEHTDVTVGFCDAESKRLVAFARVLTDYVYKGYPEPMRYAGVTMCAVFVLGLVALPFAPETKGQPLPE